LNITGWMQIFGGAGPWVATLGGLFAASLIIAAFRQGRAISIWWLKIGSRPLGAARRTAIRRDGPRRDGAPRRDRGNGADREYTVNHARSFYQKIARYYDNRNSGNLVATHLATVAQLQVIRRRRPVMRVLDVGGGTGKLIAVHFFNDAQVSWTYLDFSPAMAEEFRRNLAGYPLSENIEVIVADLHVALRELPAASYDVILFSLVLSSMPDLPDFGPVARLLAPGGELIVTDINPGYTHNQPLYMVRVESSVVALRTTPVDPYEVMRRATAAGLSATMHRTLGDGNTYYSFMAAFTPAPVAGEYQEALALAAEEGE
jgi:ubiquinone/menaquinone biosynthesis C-methylase UbiE